MMENTHRLSPAFSIEHVAGASSSGIRHGKLVFTHVPQWAARFTACAARGFGLPRTGWRTPQRILTRHLVTDSFTSKLQSPSGTWSSRWRRSKGATLSALSARCLSSRRSFDDYPGPSDARARNPHSVRIPSTNGVPLHPHRYHYHWSGWASISCDCLTTRMTLPTSSESSGARISSSIARS